MSVLTENEKQSLKNADSQSEWNRITEKIVVDRKGKYPSDWLDVLFGYYTPKYLLKNKPISGE